MKPIHPVLLVVGLPHDQAIATDAALCTAEREAVKPFNADIQWDQREKALRAAQAAMRAQFEITSEQYSGHRRSWAR